MNCSENIQQAVEFVKRNGNDLERAKLNVLIGNEIENSQQQIFDYYLTLQNIDGGFPFKNIKRNISTINHTTVALQAMNYYGLVDSEITEKGIDFLLERQTEEGYWDEHNDLLILNPPPWDYPGELNTQLWLTANVCHLFIQLNLTPSPYINKGLNFILSHREKEGKIRGYLHTNWILVAILGTLEGPKSRITKSFVDIITNNIEEILGTSDVIWCLNCFLDGGISKEHSTVKRMIDNLVESQNSSGNWQSIDGVNFDSETTLSAIQLLKRI